MQQKLLRRLQWLEHVQAQVRSAERWRELEAEDATAIRRIESFLEFSGTKPGSDPKESLAAATARTLGISYDELLELVDQEIDPIEWGLEREKAAEQVPGGLESSNCE